MTFDRTYRFSAAWRCGRQRVNIKWLLNKRSETLRFHYHLNDRYFQYDIVDFGPAEQQLKFMHIYEAMPRRQRRHTSVDDDNLHSCCFDKKPLRHAGFVQFSLQIQLQYRSTVCCAYIVGDRQYARVRKYRRGGGN